MRTCIQATGTVPIYYQGRKRSKEFIADLVVEEKVIVELKSVAELHPVHHKQLFTYLKLSGCKPGLLINFNVPLIKDGIKRIVNGL